MSGLLPFPSFQLTFHAALLVRNSRHSEMPGLIGDTAEDSETDEKTDDADGQRTDTPRRAEADTEKQPSCVILIAIPSSLPGGR